MYIHIRYICRMAGMTVVSMIVTMVVVMLVAVVVCMLVGMTAIVIVVVLVAVLVNVTLVLIEPGVEVLGMVVEAMMAMEFDLLKVVIISVLV